MEHDFKIKILSGNKIILVEFNGFDSELFIPAIRDNRVVLENVIQNRRNGYKKIVQKKSVITTKNHDDITDSSLDLNRLSKSPPDIVRRCPRVPFERSPLVSIKNDIIYSPVNKNKINVGNENFKLIKLFRKSNASSPKRPAKLVSIGVPRSPLIENFNYTISNFKSPQDISEQKKRHKTYKGKSVKSPPRTITKWRKCRTPIRTYSKKKTEGISKSKEKLKQPPTPRIIPINKIPLPDYIRNPTNGIDANAFLIVKKKKLLRDLKINISTPMFKKQMHEKTNLNVQQSFLPKLKVEYINSIRNRPHELLTNFSRSRYVSRKLSEMYEKRCVNKICSPKKKYIKLIGKVSPLAKNRSNKEISKLMRLQPRKLNI